jgi:NADH:ubiquinone oxidoreductase subunit E
MKNVKVKICVGTTCFVLGASSLQSLESMLPEDIKDKVEVSGAHCLGYCKEQKYGKAPFVTIDEEVVSSPSLPELIEKIKQRVREKD